MSTTCIVILISIVVVIVLGYLLKVNFGLMGIAAAFICGVCLAGMSANSVIGMWSSKLFFQMFSITFFYAFAINNGTLELLAKKLVYATRKATFLTPVILFAICGIIAGIGPGTISTFLIVTPIVMQVAKETGMNPALAAITLSCGVNAGGWSPIASNGITLRGIIESSGYAADLASSYESSLFRNMLLASLVFFVIAYIVFRGWKCHAAQGEEAPAAFSKQQRISITLIAIFTVLVVLPPVLKSLVGGSFFSSLAKKMDATFLAVVFGVLSVILKAGDEKKAIAGVPWKTIIMVCGMGMLISVASEAGAMDYLSEYVGGTFSASALPYVIGIVAAVMSLFSSTMGVVVPALYPLIFAICSASGANPIILFSIVPLAATSAGNSPFSLQGGLVQSALDTDEERNRMFITLIVIAVVLTLLSLLMVALGIVNY
jgi:di/tricarboxylate transporter